MPTKVDFDRVKLCILDPILRHWGFEYDLETQADIVDDLAKFSENTLKVAMREVRQSQKRRPSVAHLIEECKKVAPERRRSIANDNNILSKAVDVAKLRDMYLETFKTISSAWGQSVREGWDIKLFDYVYAVADVQAQIIIETAGIGWNGPDIFGAATRPTESDIKGFFSEQRTRCRDGHIDVGIPTTEIREWQDWAEWRKRQPGFSEDARRARTKLPENPALDAFIADALAKQSPKHP